MSKRPLSSVRQWFCESIVCYAYHFLMRVFDFPWKDASSWRELYGYSKSQVFLGAMSACYPLGFVMHLLPYGDVRHWFSFITGAVLLQICWEIHWIHTLLTSLTVYIMLRLCPRDQVQKVVPTFLMAYLAVAHFQHQFTVTNYLGLDIYFTCSQMILTQKLYMLAYNLVRGWTALVLLERRKIPCELTVWCHVGCDRWIAWWFPIV